MDRMEEKIETIDQGIKLCECGCGKPTPISSKSRNQWSYKKGEPTRFIRGHFIKRYPYQSSSFNNGFHQRRFDGRWIVCCRDGTKVYWSHIVYQKGYLEGKEIPKGYVIHHKDGDPSNDILSNLDLLVDQKAHAILHGTRKKPVVLIKDCAIMEFESLKAASILLKTTYQSIGQSIKKKRQVRGWQAYYLED
jgi:hypothetical protein